MSYICFEKVSKSFNKNPVISSADFSIEKGEICGFVGRNGSGKTVIFKLMTGLLMPDTGNITIDNENYSKSGRFYPSAGVMIETPGFIPHYSGLKNLRILNSMSNNPVPKEEICALMERLGLDPKNHRPVRTYSLGMRQKLGIIQAVMNNPRLLVLDEPNTYMDRHFQKDMYRLLCDLNTDCAVVIVSHDVDVVQKHANRVLRVNSGVVEM